ncbi:serine/threonine protein kinase [Dulcicalothrix desertica PCC 7102]|uniref:Serine/threonine protein kinase n=1 Tax=Dulcicalothrix desertica PCC 7102 TaxID=232991 RepID=A0A3S1CIL0_9CYAN|nr:FHA domain-containing serine/threonine-protein kinase [Dulcicalothrix desertica]RUT08228.1 serine/threonine protein kinase [Dulcicalothrix desertica PCC 7102]TWH40099.1 serine/threonine-protein kinase [Dulcicalothrix desertica PCC 7102]
MVTLTLLEPRQKKPLHQWNFSDEPLIRIGRASDNHIVISDDLVSRYHLELRRVDTGGLDGSWHLVNKGINGTFVDGVLVAQAPIPNNCLLQLANGGPLLRFQIEQKVEQPVAKPKITLPTCNHEGNNPNNLFCIHCGQPIKVLQTVRNYQVLRTLGQGGMGTTFLAWDAVGQTGRPQLLVLKQMNADMARIAKAQELFEREANTLKSLSHPGIPKYYDFFVEEGKKYLAMELVHGEDLEKLVFLKGPVTPNQAIFWMIQTCDVLSYLHSQEPPLIHRDIKPANLMMRSSNNNIVVLDFGAVKESSTAPGTRIGAEGYCAPEQERGQPLTVSDLYAIGPTLIFLLSGESPFKYYRQRGRQFRFEIGNIPTITPKLREVIDRLTEPLPRDRYQTAQEVIAVLKEL